MRTCVCRDAGVGTSAFAGWTIRESDVKGSNLEQMVKEGASLVHVVDDAAWEGSNFASAEDVAWFRDARYGMFICYGLSTYVNRDLSWGVMEGVLPDRSRGPIRVRLGPAGPRRCAWRPFRGRSWRGF